MWGGGGRWGGAQGRGQACEEGGGAAWQRAGTLTHLWGKVSGLHQSLALFIIVSHVHVSTGGLNMP